MEVQKGQRVMGNEKQQIAQDSVNASLLTISLHPTVNATCGINQDNETSGSLMNNANTSGAIGNMHKSSSKLRVCRCPDITAQDKKRHIIFCISIIFMLSCLSIVFVAVANMFDKAEKSNFTTDHITDDVLLVVFGVATFVSLFVALYSQRHADSSIFRVARAFFGNSMQWKYTSIVKPCDVTTGEVI